MLGLIFGRSAGETRFEPVPLTLLRFLAPLALLESDLLSLRMAPGVEAVMGDPTRDGLGTADCPLADAGVLEGPSLGVFRAVTRGVPSDEASETCVFNCGSDGRAFASGAAAAGS